MMRAIVAACLLMGSVPVIGTLSGFSVQPDLSSWWSGAWPWERPALEKELRGIEGKHLVLVKYGPRPMLNVQWIYNDADIDGSKIVWARDMGEEGNRSLLKYFEGRRVWRVGASESPARLVAADERNAALPQPN
jgi:hypothetical protein